VKRVERDDLRLLTFAALAEAGLICYLSTRPLDVRDDADRQRFIAAAGLDPRRTAIPRQVHKSDIVRVGPTPPAEPFEADGLVTDVPGQPLFLRAADCSLIVVADPEHRAVGVAHAGWRGSARGVIVNLVHVLQEDYGARPSRLLAGVGPTIGRAHFAVGPEVPAAFLRSRDWTKEYLHAHEGQLYFDLRGANTRFLVESGLPRTSIEVADYCTFESAGLLHSFRRDGVASGHQGLVAAWPEGAVG
jgi:YfiH family protein